MSKVYQFLYPEESDNCHYVYWSRLAATKMTAGYCKYDYFRRFLYHKVNQGYRLQEIFKSMELEDMLEVFLKSEENTNKYSKESVLDENAAEIVKCYLKKNWEAVLEHYRAQTECAGKYYRERLAGCRKAAAVDIGWAGSGAVALDYLVNNEWKLNCSIVGLLAGTNTVYNQEPDASEPLLKNGKLEAYIFSQSHNRDIWKKHNPNKGDNITAELLLASEERSFRAFLENGEMEFSAGRKEIDAKSVQQGILDFVSWYTEKMGEGFKISGRDAYAPLLTVLENDALVKHLLCVEKAQMNLE